MKKITLISLSLCMLALSSNAQISSSATSTGNKTEILMQNNSAFKNEKMNPNAISINNEDSPMEIQKAENAKKTNKKKFKDTLGGKVLIGVGIGVFVIICILYGKVSVGSK